MLSGRCGRWPSGPAGRRRAGAGPGPPLSTAGGAQVQTVSGANAAGVGDESAGANATPRPPCSTPHRAPLTPVQGDRKAIVPLHPVVWASPPRVDLIHRVVEWRRALLRPRKWARRGLIGRPRRRAAAPGLMTRRFCSARHPVKNRSEVSGSMRKILPQKGSGAGPGALSSASAAHVVTSHVHRPGPPWRLEEVPAGVPRRQGHGPARALVRLRHAQKGTRTRSLPPWGAAPRSSPPRAHGRSGR